MEIYPTWVIVNLTLCIQNDSNISVAIDVEDDRLWDDADDDSETNSDVDYVEYDTDDGIGASVEPLILALTKCSP